MGKIRIIRDMDECEKVWKAHYPEECFFDLWDVRKCFADAYRRNPYFIVYENEGKIEGLLPLSHIEETDGYAFFPGETWHGKTWMEQNKVLARNSHVLHELVEAIPGHANVRYLSTHPDLSETSIGVNTRLMPDEIGYLFFPEQHGYSYENYLGTLSGKSRKKILAEVARIKDQGVQFRIDHMADLDWVFRLNIQNFGESSYFHDPRFMKAFWRLIDLMKHRNMLRVVTLSVGGEIAAVDIGALHGKDCILLAGGTHRGYPGVAKVINLFHLEWACNQRMDSLDFLCGDFGWKERFRLSPRPLYQFNINTQGAVPYDIWNQRMEEYAA